MLDFFKQHSHIFVIFDYEVLFNQGLENALGDFRFNDRSCIDHSRFPDRLAHDERTFFDCRLASNKTISMGLINPNVSAHSFWARVHSKKRCFNVSLSPLIESQFKIY